MNTLSSEKNALFLREIEVLRQQLQQPIPDSMVQSLERFENHLTLDELETCFLASDLNALHSNLTTLLSMRWERIRNSDMCYTQQPNNPVNQLCFEIAKAISPPSATVSEIDDLVLNTGPYCLLMPSLTNSVTVYGENIHSLGLHEFVLSDQDRVFIPLAECLHQASIAEEGVLRHLVAIDEGYPELTPSEIERVSQHSTQANELYQAVMAFNEKRLIGVDICPKLNQLVIALRGGGTTAGNKRRAEAIEAIRAAIELGVVGAEAIRAAIERGVSGAEAIRVALERGDLSAENAKTLGKLRLGEYTLGEYTPGEYTPGEEFNAGSEANLGIFSFSEYWDTLTEQQKSAIFTEEPELKNILGRLLRPDDLNYQETRYCVELLAAALEPIIERYSQKQALHVHVLKKESTFKEAAQSSQGLAIIKKGIPPTNIRLYIYKLMTDEHNRLSKHYKSALMYVLAHEPEALTEFQFDEQSKQDAISVQVNTNNDSALIAAAKKGAIDAVKLLLSWEAHIESHDLNRCTALHSAVANGNGAVVELLLKNNACVNVRNNKGENALDLAIAKHPELIDPILKHLAMLPAEEQAACLLEVKVSHRAPSRSSYKNVFSYAAFEYKTDLFKALVHHVSQSPDKTLSRAVFNAAIDDRGITPLMCAAVVGAHECLLTLLESGVDIESHDVRNGRALHYAAICGHVEIVNYLLDRGALLEARGHGDDSVLNCAVKSGKYAIVELLLKKNAEVNARNSAGKNALDLAIAHNPSLIEPILKHLAMLPAEEQAACLLKVKVNVSNHLPYLCSYKNVFSYAAFEYKTDLFKALVHHVSQSPDKTLSRAVFNAAIDDRGITPLMCAAVVGAHECLPTLLESGVDIESHDVHNFRALHYAAICGHVEIVNYLLDRGALLEARGHGYDSVLNCAAKNGKYAIVELLLKKNAEVNARNSAGKNALDLAIAYSPRLIDPILMHLAMLPAEEQAKCLRTVSGGPYPNVLFYAAHHRSRELFNALVHQVLQSSDQALILTVFNASDEAGLTPLLLAARQGAYNSLAKLLELDLDIDVLGALHDAVNRHDEVMVKLLLNKNADVNARNSEGKNALDLAIADSPSCIWIILEHLAKLSVEKQAECLIKVPGGPYPNVSSYVIKNASLSEQLFTNHLYKQGSQGTLEIGQVLSQMHFDEHLKSIRLHYQLMEEKSQNNPKYNAAVSTAKTLFMDCVKAKETLFTSDAPIKDKIRTFQKTCKDAIETAKPELKKYREWGNVLAAFLLALVTLPVSLPLYALGFFSAKTQSEQQLDKLHQAITCFR